MFRILFLVACFVSLACTIMLGFRHRTWQVKAFATLGFAPWLFVAITELGWIPEMLVRFRTPLAAPVCAAVSAYMLYRIPPARISGARAAWVQATTWALGCVLSIVLLSPELGHPVNRLAILVAIDRSHSIDLVPKVETRLRAELEMAERSMHEGDLIGVVHFASGARIQSPLRAAKDPAPDQSVSIGRDATDIETAIRRSLVELPSGAAGRIVVVSDGVETRGNALEGAVAATLSEIPIDTLLLEQKKAPELRIVQVLGPKKIVSDREAVEIRIVTQSSREAEVELRIKRDGVLVKRLQTRIAPGEDVLRARDDLASPGMHRYEVEITAKDSANDSAVDDNSGATFVRVKGRGMALLVEQKSGEEAPTLSALRAAGFLVDVRTPSSMPFDLAGLSSYDVIVWGSIPAADVSTSTLEALGAYVKDTGGGLLLLGGPDSFGPGGYIRTPVEDVSPVSFELKRDQRKASLAEVIAIDYSGSMGAEVSGQTKLALANEAAARSAALLSPGDRLGVEHVDTIVAWTVPLGPITDSKAVGNAIRGVGVGGGGIYTDLALREAYGVLRKETTNLKHVLLFADGGDAEQLTGCRRMVEDALRAGISTSVISLGKGSDSTELEVLAKLGKGRFYLVDDAARLPSVFTQETMLATRSSFREERFVPKLAAPSPFLRGLSLEAMPALLGYTVTNIKPRAELLMTALDADPLLATWSIGTGHAAAFTSDYHNRWGAAWLYWPDAGALFAQVTRGIARSISERDVRVDASAKDGTLTVQATARDSEGRAAIHKQLTAIVSGPDGSSKSVELSPVGAGSYSAKLPLSRKGAYITTLKDTVTGELLGITGSDFTSADELRGGGSDAPLLAHLANASKGSVRTTLAGIFNDRGPRRIAYESVDRALLWIAGVLLLAMVAVRRLSLPALSLRSKFARAAANTSPMDAENKAAHASWLASRAKRKAPPERDPAATAAPAALAPTAPIDPKPVPTAAATPAPMVQGAAHTALSLAKKKRDRE
jgi:Ca-activated chloride channel homolog